MTTPIPPNECDAPLDVDYRGQVLSNADDDQNPLALPEYQRLVADEAADGTIHIVPTRESMLSPCMPRANLGLREIIDAEARSQGRSVNQRIRTRGYPVLPPPAAIEPIEGRLVNTHVLQFVHEHDRGIVHLGPGVNRITIMAELMKGYPRQNFAVMTATHGQAQLVQSQLRQLGVNFQRFPDESDDSDVERVAVGQFNSLRDRGVEFEHRSILIAYDARHALAERAQLLLTQPDVCGRLYGFLGDDAHICPLQEQQIAATFGFERLNVPVHGGCLVSVNATFMECPVRSIDADKALTVKRKGIWKNHHRHQVLKKTARALVEGDCEAISRYLPDYHEPIGCRRVILLTDSIEHVASLAGRFGSSPIRIDREYNDRGLTSEEQRRLARGTSHWRTGPVWITTPSGLADIAPGTFDAVIWAGSGSGFPPIPWKHRICPAGAPRQLLLVDVDDRHHPQLRRWSRERREVYRDMGWMDAGMNPTRARISRFLAKFNSEVSG